MPTSERTRVRERAASRESHKIQTLSNVCREIWFPSEPRWSLTQCCKLNRASIAVPSRALHNCAPKGRRSRRKPIPRVQYNRAWIESAAVGRSVDSMASPEVAGCWSKAAGAAAAAKMRARRCTATGLLNQPPFLAARRPQPTNREGERGARIFRGIYLVRDFGRTSQPTCPKTTRCTVD